MKSTAFPIPPIQVSKRAIAIFTIILFHAAGFPFIAYETTRSLFLLATPFTLLLSTVLLLWNHDDWSPSFVLFCATTFCVGFGAEVIGVQTGYLFGEYAYGTVLGWKLGGVPLVIGTNWLMCIYCCGVIADRFPFNGWVKAGIGAVLMLLLDAVIEPVAMKMGFWQWENNLIPLWNYGTWFIASFMLLCLYYRLPFQKDNLVATTLYFTLWLFFGFLNFV